MSGWGALAVGVLAQARTNRLAKALEEIAKWRGHHVYAPQQWDGEVCDYCGAPDHEEGCPADIARKALEEC